MKIVHLPLDSRPCNVLFPVQLAQWCGHECVIPPKEKMDHFATAAHYEDSRTFLMENAAKADAVVVSADHLCYGSLVASRVDDASEKDALDRLNVLGELHAAWPDIPIYVYSVIMRSSISTLYAGDIDDYNAMTEYSVYSGRRAVTGNEEDARCAERAKARLSHGVLERYERVRARNHAVNLRCVELAAQGVIRSLALLQEDAQVYGFHRAEQFALQNACREKHADNVFMHNGADEGGALTVMKAILEYSEPKRIAVRMLGWKNADFVACYEDRPFGENVWDTIAFAGLGADENAQNVLAVCCPPDGVQTDWPRKQHEEGLKKQAEEIAAMVRAGKNVYLLDVTRANGGQPALVKYLHEELPALAIAGYSAWNTASNALGTAVAQMISDMLAGKINRGFFWERLLDDLVYQGMVRAQVNEELSAIGEDPYRLQDKERAETMIRERMAQLAETEKMFADAPAFTVSLPWERTFEAEIRVAK